MLSCYAVYRACSVTLACSVTITYVIMGVSGHLAAAEDLAALTAAGSYEEILALGNFDNLENDEKLLWWQAQLALGHYQEVQELLNIAEKKQALSWMQRGILYRSCVYIGQRKKILAMRAQAHTAYTKEKNSSAEDLTAMAEILADDNIEKAWDCVQQAHNKDAHYLPAYYVGAGISIQAYSFQNAFDELGELPTVIQKTAVVQSLLARLYVSQGDYRKAHQALALARTANPRLQSAINLRILLDVQRHHDDDVPRLLQQAQAVNAIDPETLALQAAWHDASGRSALRDDSIARITDLNPHNTQVFEILAEAAERRYRYSDALAWGRKALKADPEAWQGMYISAVNLLRMGEEDEGYALLEKSFEKNPYNVWAFNLLSVLDGDVREQRYVLRETQYFAMKVPKEIDLLITPYLQEWLDPLYESLAQEFQFKPIGPKQYKGKILLLFFERHDEFAARTTGLPGLPAHGATFGSVVTMPMNESDDRERIHPWYSTLVHEITHVFTIQKTQWRIPRWFTEGLSEWKEGEPHVEMDRMLSELVAAGKVPSIADMSDGIHRPQYQGQVSMTYYLSALVVMDLEQRYGLQAINEILEKLSSARPMTEIFTEVTQVSVRAYDKLFMKFLIKYCEQLHYRKHSASEDDFKTLEAAQKLGSISAQDRMTLIYDYIAHKDVAAAQELAVIAEKDFKTQRQALIAQGIIALQFARNGIEALDFFNRVLAVDDQGFEINYWAGRAALKAQDETAAGEFLEAAQRSFPRFSRSKLSPYNLLASIYRSNQDLEALERIRHQHVQSDAYYYPANRELALLLCQAEKWKAAEKALERCIQFDIYDQRLYYELGVCREQLQEPQRAADAYRSVLHLESEHIEANEALKRLEVTKN